MDSAAEGDLHYRPILVANFNGHIMRLPVRFPAHRVSSHVANGRALPFARPLETEGPSLVRSKMVSLTDVEEVTSHQSITSESGSGFDFQGI